MNKYQHPNLLNDKEECMPLVTDTLLQLSSLPSWSFLILTLELLVCYALLKTPLLEQEALA